MRIPRAALVSAMVAATLGLAACSANAVPASAPAAKASALSGTLVVDAAASLTGTFQKLGAEFHAEHPGVTVTFNFGGSSALAAQIVSGAPADVFASASPATMKSVTDAGAAATAPVVFVRNRLEIAVPASNPGHVTGLKDLADPAKKIALCAPEVPCGAAAVTVFTKAGLTPAPDTLEPDVKAALTKVQLNEVDAALVYRTDVQAAGDGISGISFPEADSAINDYLIAPLKASTHRKLAAAFVAFILGDHGKTVLGAAGFDLPKSQQ
ncbi:molybdate ABC transporter substrate-binding protein [Parafrigoribacterium soli]|uniref:molybdate ABC transporter substrate-binding protein n=1 Tax=Parafrigoribacterium soli TaxID=3144663 RepID=UPI0032EBB72B